MHTLRVLANNNYFFFWCDAIFFRGNQTKDILENYLIAENINYKFPGSTANVLNEISFKIENSEKILLDGDNGSGKTTLIRILSGLIQPTSGSFFINDDTYRKIDLQQYRSQIATIINGETPFEGTILENITFNNPAITQEDIKWAIESVKLGSFIKSLPNGLETKIFPEGKQLSSSNAQKILLARSIVNKPKILFYEDALDRMDADVAKEQLSLIKSQFLQQSSLTSLAQANQNPNGFLQLIRG
jgi:ABC-type bacteriocin/lantibiotic exporter with double-glycine peptidase domain